jgi:hypothetical protein
MQPVVHGLEEQYGNQIEFVYLDIDDPASDEAKQALGFRFQPHFLLLDEQGAVAQQWLGYVVAEDFERAFAAAIGTGP